MEDGTLTDVDIDEQPSRSIRACGGIWPRGERMKKNTICTRRNAREGQFLVLPLMAGCALFFAVPFLMVLKNSFQLGTGKSREFVGLETYGSMLRSSVFRLVIGNTLKFLAVALPLILFLSYAIALLLKSQAEIHAVLKSVLLLPFMEQRAKTASKLTGFAERIFSMGDTEQFLNQLPRIAGGAAVLLAGLVFLIAAWRMPKAGLLRCVNGALAALCLCLLPGTLSKILLPGSLLPEENVFALSHYCTALDTVFNGLDAFPDAFQALAQVRDTAFSASGRVLLLGAGIAAGILLLECGLQWAEKRRKRPSK